MGVGLYLTGTYESGAIGQSAEDWLEQVASWLEGHEEEPLMLCHRSANDANQPTLFVQMHPCAEEVEISVPTPGMCAVVAKTSTAGPGYHIFLCNLLHSLGNQFQLEWHDPDEQEDTGDETGYFFHQNASLVRQEMLRWLSALSRVVVENCLDDDVNIRMVSMPLDYSFPEQEGILTPTGPRAPNWFEQMVETPERGIEFFPWWSEGVGAPFFLGRALCRLWQEVRWRTPITEDEGELLMDVHLDLERAYHLDPTSPMPWREWQELLEYLTEYFGYAEFQHEESLEEEIQKRAAEHDADAPRIGYRRGPVQVLLTGNWSITIPGEFAEEWEEGGETWSAWHGGRTVWFTSWSVQGEDEETLQPREILDSRSWPDDGEFIDYEEGVLLGRAVFVQTEEEGQTLWNLKGYSAVEGNFALCNIYLQDECDREWAVGVWKSLRNQP
ncbi:MAG TPA: hypothetical protein VFE62_27055 [Gemmataceae bacterium]|nr:hypothetical protein [Gemmataceae bacterium]